MSLYRSALLTDLHDTAPFFCGNAALDDWLRRLGLRAQAQGWAKTFVWLDEGERVVAYYSVAPTVVSGEGLSRKARGGVSELPGYLLARLALDTSLQGRGLGWDLLWDALETICDAAAVAGGRIIVVDAIDSGAAAFYRHHGFQTVGASDRLAMLVASAQASLDQLRREQGGHTFH